MRHLILSLAILAPLLVASQWTYDGSYLGVPVPLDSVLLENLSQGGSVVVPGNGSLEPVVVGINDLPFPIGGANTLLPGRPNPFLTYTTFGLAMAKAGDATLAVFDATGRSIANLDLKNLAPGIHGFQFNGPHVGVYFVSSRTGGVPQVLRLVQLAGDGQADLHYTGATSGKPKDGNRDLSPWTEGDIVRHTAYATLPCDVQALYTVQDTPTVIEHYDMLLEQVPPGGQACLLTDPIDLQLAAPCVGGHATRSFRLVGAHLDCPSISISSAPEYTFALNEAGPFSSPFVLPIPGNDSLDVIIHVQYTPSNENDNTSDLILDCGSTQATILLSGSVNSTLAAGELSGNANICVNGTTTFSSTVGGGSWSSSDTNVATINASTGVINGGASGMATMTYTVSSTGCDDATATRDVTVNAPPSAGMLAGTQDICVGSTTTFGSTVSGGAWSSSNTSVATINTSTGVINGVAAGTATMTYTVTGTGGCPNATATRTVTVTAAPSAGTLSGTQSICLGGSSTFSSTVSGGSWSSSNTNVATINASTGVINGLTAGAATMTYTVTGTGGCPNATATRTLTVTAAPSAGTLSGTQSICVGSSTTFSSTVSGGSWSSSNTNVATINASTGVVNGVTAGTATMTYTVSTPGCDDATATRTVTVATSISAGTLSGNQSICVNGTTTFTSTVGGGSWSSSNTSVATINASTGVVNGLTAGMATMTYTVSGGGGCPNATATRTLTVTAAPSTGTLNGTQSICVNSTTTFSSTVGGGTWSSSNTNVATINASTGVINGVAAGTATMTYTVTGTGGCPNATATRTVTVATSISAGTLSGNQSICVNGTTTFSSTVGGGSWSSSNTNVATINSSTGVINGLTAGTATMTYMVTGTGGCPNATATRTLTVTAAPSAGTLSGTQSVCVGSSTTFSSTVSGGGWSSSNTSVATINASTGVVNGVTAGTATMTYTVIGAGGCSNATATRTVTVATSISAGTLSGNQSICVNGTTTFSSTVGGGSWSSSNTSVATINASTGVINGVAASTTTMTYTVSGGGGCPNATATRTVTVTAAPSAGTLSGTQSICVGSSSTFSSTVGGGSWSSSNAGVATINASTGVINGLTAGMATMTYTVTGGGGCPNATATRTVTVTAAPSAAIVYEGSPYCNTGSAPVILTGSEGGTFSPDPPGLGLALNHISGNVDLEASSPGTYTVTYSIPSSNGCPAFNTSTEITIDQNICPTLVANGGDLGSQCIGDFYFNLYLFGSNLEPGGTVTISGDPGLQFSALGGASSDTHQVIVQGDGSLISTVRVYLTFGAIELFTSTINIQGAGASVVIPVSANVQQPQVGPVSIQPGSPGQVILSGTDLSGPCDFQSAGFEVATDGDTTIIFTGGPAPQFWTAEFNVNPGQAYSFRAWADYLAGNRVYGNWVDHGSNTCPSSFPYFGVDYPTVQIGSQCWFAENLRSSQYRNGTPIQEVTDPGEWSLLSLGAWCNYNNDPANDPVYGKLYNWYAVDNPNGLCPMGWHVPTDAEWQQLEAALGMPASELGLDGIWRGTDQNIGSNLKATTGWSADATNDSGFSGLPGGNRSNSGNFSNIGGDAYWWTASEDGSDWASYRNLNWFYTGVWRSSVHMKFGLCVRCLKD